MEIPGVDSVDQACNNPEVTRVYGHSMAAKHLRRSDLAEGESLSGPVIITEYSATTYVAPGWSVNRDEWGNLVLCRGKESE